MRSCFQVALFVLLAAIPACGDQTGPGPKNAIVLVIRHAEKPDAGTNLSPAGEQRAQAYVKYFQELTVAGTSVRPDLIFAARDSKASARPRLTVEPFAKAAGLPVDARFSSGNPAPLMAALQALPTGKRILICWHHGDVPNLLRSLGADPATVLPKGKWPDPVFGWVIMLRFDQQGALVEAKRIKEHLMPDGSQ